MNENKILVIDIETTNFLQKGGSIVEIGSVSLDLESGEITEVFNSLLREPILTAAHRDAWIFSNSDLTPEMVRDAPEASLIYPQVQYIIDHYPAGVTAYNRNFDVDFLVSRGIRFGKLLPCPMLLLTPICKLPFPRGGNGYKFPKCEEAYLYLFPESAYIEKHRGCDDAWHEAEICYELYRRGIFTI